MQKRTEGRADISALFYVYTEERGEVPMNEIFKLFGRVVVDSADAIKNLDNATDHAKDTESKFAVIFKKIGESAAKSSEKTDGFGDSVEKNNEKTDGFGDSLEKLTAKAAEQQKEMDNLKKKYKDLYLTQGESSEEAKDCAEKIKKLSAELHENKEKLEEAKKAADQLEDSLEEVGDESKEAGTKIENAGSKIEGAGTKIDGAGSKIGKAFSGFGNIALGVGKFAVASIAAISTAFIGLGASAVTYNAQMEQYTTSFEVMLGSHEKAAALVEDLKEKAAKTPFEMSDLAETTQLLLNYGLGAEEATDKMMMLGDIAQGNADKMYSIARAYGQMSSSGRVTLEDINQMIENGYNPLNDVIAITGESMEEVRERISKGTISVDEITAAMERATSEGGKYYQSMEKQSQTFSGRLSTLKDTIDSKLGEAFAGVSDTLSTKVLPTLTTFAEKYIPKIGTVAETVLPPLLSIGESFAEKVLPQLMSAGEKALPLMEKSMENLLPIALQIAEGALPLLLSVLEALGPPLLEYVEVLLPVWLEIFQKLLPPCIQIINTVLPQLITLITPILSIISPLLDLMMPLLDVVIALLGPVMSLASAFLPFVTDLANMLLTMLLPVVQQLCTFIEHYVIPLIEFLVKEVINPLFGDLLSEVFILFEGLMRFFSGFATTLEGIFNFILALFTGDWDAAGAALLQILGGIADMVVGLLQAAFFNIIFMIQKYWDDIVAFFTEGVPSFISNVVVWLQDLGAKFAEWLVTTLQKIVTWRNDLKAKAIEAIQGLIEGILQKAKEIPEKVKEIGKNIVSGVWEGILGAKDKFMENVGGFFTGIIDGAKEVLDINSPSKKFEWIGEMCVSGFDKGAEDLEDGTSFEKAANAALPMDSGSINQASNGIDYDRMTQCFVKALQTVAPELRSNVTVEGDAKGMFRTIQKQAKVFKDTTGQGAFA